jgi:hypothetical protein
MATEPLKLRIRNRLREQGIVAPCSTKRVCWMFNYSACRKLEKLTTAAIHEVQHAHIEECAKVAILDDIMSMRMEALTRLNISTGELYKSDTKHSYKDAFYIVCAKVKAFRYPDYEALLSRYMVDCTVNKCEHPT